ncbi:RNA polymerase sigma factor [Sphingobacterium faecale]|uniref:RNA polymerase sigma-70 factor n=1 Tax=Sphingobacterium faecale TaxID=2803775 RepID=A0ABS1QY89_9SPHI|nr:RNA polymerase sigma-70 factor [Sphingobacterium faecale]MBL1407145.1 RNA polymerase sigma-70 factor [Sphingobacterium faecale]
MDRILSDLELVNGLRNGDTSSYTEIYERYSGPLYLFVLKRWEDRDGAKDLVHDFFLKLWEKREVLEISSNLTAYLYTAIRHAMLNQISREKVKTRYIDSFLSFLDTVEPKGTDYLMREREMQKIIEREIDGLHPRMREVFELSRKENLSRKEIAETLGISEETVKNHMHKALKTLKRNLGVLFIYLF